MIFIIPLAPIVIALICIGLGVFGKVQDNISTISNVLMIVSIIVFAGMAIYNLFSNISTMRKIFSTITCAVLGTISTWILTAFVHELGEIEFGLLGLIEFAFVLMMGGSICLGIVAGCVYLCMMFSEDYY